MSRVRIPPVLRDAVGGARELSAEGSTVAAVLDGLFADQPALRDRLSDGGHLSAYVNVYVNDTDIRHRDGLETQVSTEDVVILLPAMAGGCGAPGASRRGSTQLPTGAVQAARVKPFADHGGR